MAKYTGPTVANALERWAEPHIARIATSMDYDGVWNASLTMTTTDGQVELTVTNVEEAPLSAGPSIVAKALDQLVNAPSDAPVLAAEVHRLREKVRRLEERQ